MRQSGKLSSESKTMGHFRRKQQPANVGQSNDSMRRYSSKMNDINIKIIGEKKIKIVDEGNSQIF